MSGFFGHLLSKCNRKFHYNKDKEMKNLEPIEKISFTIANGHTLEAEIFKANAVYSIRMISTQGEEILLENQDGIQQTISAERLHINDINLKKGEKIEVSPSLHQAWFKEYYDQQILESKALFEQHLQLLWNNRTFVYQSAQHFLIPLPNIQIGLMYMGGFSPTLGGLFELWERLMNENFHICPVCAKERLLPLFFGGSPLSGMSKLKGYCPSCEQVHYSEGGGAGSYYKYCAEYAYKNYSSLLHARTATIKELVNIILERF